MAETHVLFALRRKYAERLGVGDEAALSHLAPVIRMFSPDEDLAAIKPVRPKASYRGRSGAVWLRAGLDVLRTANEPLSAGQIAARIMSERGLSCRRVRASVECSLLATLPRYVACVEGRPRRWYVE